MCLRLLRSWWRKAGDYRRIFLLKGVKGDDLKIVFYEDDLEDITAENKFKESRFKELVRVFSRTNEVRGEYCTEDCTEACCN